MRRPLFFLFLLTFLGGFWFANALRYRDAFRAVCALTREHFYTYDETLAAWLTTCAERAEAIPLRASAREVAAAIQDHLAVLNVSHFSLFSPAEDRKLWTGVTEDTGVRAQYIENSLMIYRVEEGSAAANADLRAGDEILALPGVKEVTPWGAAHRRGLFRVARDGGTFEVEIAPTLFTTNARPRVTPLDAHTAVLRVPSFRADVFTPAAWLDVTRALQPFRHVIIDLRENTGGNFVAMLRVLSTFLPPGRLIGRLERPRRRDGPVIAMEDDADDVTQIGELEATRAIELRTFANYGHFAGRVTVLIASDTASVAEIFADALKGRARVWGLPTAGDVVLAVWYDLPLLGEGFTFSIPRAAYVNAHGLTLEGEGVRPERELHYDLATARRGRDSWIEAARR